MSDTTLFIDASFFLGMHDGDVARRLRSLAYFTRNLTSRPRMNYEQIGICDAVIWTKERVVQDLYYPFMDRLHSDMPILRSGYTYDEINLALSHPELKKLPPEQAFQAAQVLHNQGKLATHDPVLLGLDCLHGRLWSPVEDGRPATFTGELQTLYAASLVFVHNPGE